MKSSSHINQFIKSKIKSKLVFYWASSFLISSISYYLLWLIIPGHRVFGSLYRMFLYHWEHPLAYIAIMCFFFGLIATGFADRFRRASVNGQVFLTVVIIALTIFVSSPFGGMLWHFHDMLAGHFPFNWPVKMIRKGCTEGISLGWLVVGLSLPYNLFGSIVCFFLTKKGVELYES